LQKVRLGFKPKSMLARAHPNLKLNQLGKHQLSNNSKVKVRERPSVMMQKPPRHMVMQELGPAVGLVGEEKSKPENMKQNMSKTALL